MKYFIPIILSFGLISCTTGSKTKSIVNYYSNTSVVSPTIQTPEYYHVPAPEPAPTPVIIYKEKIVPVETIKYKTIYRNVPPQDVTMAGLGEEIGKKLLRKMRAAYNEN
jgi:hypothetical protein